MALFSGDRSLSTAIATPMYRKAMIGICLRLNPAQIGFQTDQNQMIVDISNNSLYEAGIVEGDKVMSIENYAYASNDPGFLRLSPFQDVKIAVIRPGVGKIIKTVKTQKNDATYLNLTDAIPWEEPKPQNNKCSSPLGNCQ